MAQGKITQSKVADLEHENAELRRSLKRLQKQLDDVEIHPRPSTVRSSGGRWKSITAWLCVIVASVLLVLGNAFFWAGNTIVNTNKYVSTVGPLLEKPAIQSAIAAYTTDQLFSRFNVTNYVKQTLPPRAEFLAPQLSTQVKNYTQTTIKTLLASSKVQAYWYSSLQRRHQAFINFSKTYKGNGDITISDIYSELSNRLASTNLSFLANKTLPSSVGSITITTIGWLPAFHNLVNNIGLYQFLATALLLILCIAAIWLSKNRRLMVIRIGVMFALFMLATLIAIRVVGALAASKVNPAYQQAISVAYSTVISFFITQTRTILLLALFVALIGWLTGPSRAALAAKARFNELLSGQIHQTFFGSHENGITKWVSNRKRLLQWLSVLLIAAIMLIVQLSPRLILIYAILLLVCFAAIEIVAAPQPLHKVG